MNKMQKEKENESKTDAYYTRRIKAGQRFYYIDAKKDSKGNDYLVLTESKSSDPNGKIERHRIFVYREDLQKFMEALADVAGRIAAGADDADTEPVADAGEPDLSETLKQGLAETSSLLTEEDESLTIQWPEDI
ncbi:DUF3276 family protein [Porphyromonas macacae]|uniref:DUF3276 family protein n=1 Tax=Porphyromonas macacae TaxID=28115 RepID=UPI00068CCCD0|nr:DUF3276 family protein [Porphyromonas macacae]